MARRSLRQKWATREENVCEDIGGKKVGYGEMESPKTL